MDDDDADADADIARREALCFVYNLAFDDFKLSEV